MRAAERVEKKAEGMDGVCRVRQGASPHWERLVILLHTPFAAFDQFSVLLASGPCAGTSWDTRVNR